MLPDIAKSKRRIFEGSMNQLIKDFDSPLCVVWKNKQQENRFLYSRWKETLVAGSKMFALKLFQLILVFHRFVF